MPGRMTHEEIEAFIDSRPGWIAVTTLGSDGYPHTVPIGYFRDGEAIYIGCRHPTQKTRNIERNPKVSLMLEAGSTMADIKGLVIQGDAALVTDPAEVLPLQRQAGRLRGTPEADLPAEARPGAAFIKVTPRKYITWDYAKGAP